MPTITVFTPTYNRAYIITKLFKSLCIQTNLDFEWIIVDDGSSDNTEIIIDEMKKEAKFSIIYIKKENEGKHIAINEGVKVASGRWFFIVDSDDYLTRDAIEKVIYYCNGIEGKKDIAGVVGLRGNQEGVAWTDWYQKNKRVKEIDIPNILDCTYIDYRYKYKIKGDRAEVVRTEILKKYPFPKFENEKFFVESYLWLSLAKDNYKFRWFKDVIYITEYLDDGLTQNIAKNYRENPIGSNYIANLELSCSGIPLKKKIKSCYNYYRYGFYTKKSIKQLVTQCASKLLSQIGFCIALIKK